MAMRIKTHLNNALYQITAVCFEHEPELVITKSPAGKDNEAYYPTPTSYLIECEGEWS